MYFKMKMVIVLWDKCLCWRNTSLLENWYWEEASAAGVIGAIHLMYPVYPPGKNKVEEMLERVNPVWEVFDGAKGRTLKHRMRAQATASEESDIQLATAVLDHVN